MGEYVMFQTVYTNPPSSAWYFATRLHRCFMWRGSNRDHEEVPRPYNRPEVVQSIRDIQTVYDSWQVPHAQQPSFGTGVPVSGLRQNRYLGPSWVLNNDKDPAGVFPVTTLTGTTGTSPLRGSTGLLVV